MSRPTRFKAPERFDAGQLEALLADRFAFVAETPQVDVWTIYDTFDWRLFNKGLTLRWSDQEVQLCRLQDGEIIRRQQASGPPRFSRALPAGEVPTALQPIVRERALLEQGVAHTWSVVYRILNEDEKTVVRLAYTEARLTAGREGLPVAAFLVVQPLRGYKAEAHQLAAFLRKGLQPAAAVENVTCAILKALGNPPGAYSGKLDIKLEPDMPAAEATKLILRRLLEMMRANEAGIKADIDVEFLHDYRIAVRRTRSALSQIRNVFPPETVDHFKQEFRALGKLTNDLRDLDVYLAAEPEYRALLPDAMQEDIAPLFDYLRSHRAEALSVVVAGLESEAYARMLAEWEAFLLAPVQAESAPKAAVPVIKLARKRIDRQYRRIVQRGAYVLEHTEDELLHALRIECKKLRYLLEFFASLFPPKKMARLIKQLKRLQDNLGAFTDLAVQQDYLLAIAESLDIDEVRARRALVATGFLVETMARRQQEVKTEFAGTFTRFASPAHQKEFKRLFGKGKGGKR